MWIGPEPLDCDPRCPVCNAGREFEDVERRVFWPTGHDLDHENQTVVYRCGYCRRHYPHTREEHEELVSR